ncbi:unnamed protein product [Rotaria socialis]|uniref:Uncharacterized protein n=1 Tax=Rotaria socialis TaxID=392032 RepID=A0A818F614_9BILA|nr:unnamed protein product [Rotaria socialis]CAF3334453.1 unnamed protein product [Rotaria socialis]CAF3423842.1 unnamed protein product [Rotaria socialis]CAF3469958.1 unnamed protein product [Rotaria socialis]CAF3493697.1 unnamed protein product [Rotaria socialis]
MDMSDNDCFTRPTAIIIQPSSSQIDSKSNRIIFRLGWTSFILGFCAFIIHYISLDHLENFSPINAGLISGILLMISGLASVGAGYKEKSYRCFILAQIWSFITNIILAPGLIAVSITALILDSNDISPMCQSTVLLSSSRKKSFENNLDVYPSNLPCLEATNLFHLTQILNIIQLIIGVTCFVIHIGLLSIQRKVITQMKNEKNDYNNNKIIVYTDRNNIAMNHAICYTDAPPKYEDLPLTQILRD